MDTDKIIFNISDVGTMYATYYTTATLYDVGEMKDKIHGHIPALVLDRLHTAFDKQDLEYVECLNRTNNPYTAVVVRKKLGDIDWPKQIELERESEDLKPTNTSVEDRIINVLIETLGITKWKKEDFKMTWTLRDLKADSLDKVEILMALEEEFEIEIDDNSGKLLAGMTLGDICRQFSSL